MEENNITTGTWVVLHDTKNTTGWEGLFASVCEADSNPGSHRVELAPGLKRPDGLRE